jgi:hypothetical protein
VDEWVCTTCYVDGSPLPSVSLLSLLMNCEHLHALPCNQQASELAGVRVYPTPPALSAAGLTSPLLMGGPPGRGSPLIRPDGTPLIARTPLSEWHNAALSEALNLKEEYIVSNIRFESAAQDQVEHGSTASVVCVNCVPHPCAGYQPAASLSYSCFFAHMVLLPQVYAQLARSGRIPRVDAFDYTWGTEGKSRGQQSSGLEPVMSICQVWIPGPDQRWILLNHPEDGDRVGIAVTQ